MLQLVRTDATSYAVHHPASSDPPLDTPFRTTLHSSMAASTRGHSTVLVDDLWTTGTISKQRTTTMTLFWEFWGSAARR